MHEAATHKSRIEAIDLARGTALGAMIVFHFAWDLEFFGYVPPGMTREGGWLLFARAIASSFLFLVGVSLLLAHGRGLRMRSYLKRLFMIVAAAAAITAATLVAVPQGFIFFGILHQIALASVLGLLFLRLPVAVIVAVAVFVIAAPQFLRHSFFDHPVWWWVGLSSVNPPANDYVPLFPWFGAVLLGIAAARLARSAGWLERLAQIRPGPWSRPVRFAGRHSLAVYLLHQPVLIGAIWLFAQVAPPAAQPMTEDFLQACNRECATIRDGDFCLAYCSCVLDEIEAAGLHEAMWARGQDDETRLWLEGTAMACSMDAESAPEWEGDQ